MATTTMNMKQYDLYPSFRTRLTDIDGNAVDLTDATEVRLLVKNRTAGLKVDATMTKLDQDDDPGVVEYNWEAGDTDTLGSFQVEIEVTFPGNLPQTFPGKGYCKLNINRDLNAGPVQESS